MADRLPGPRTAGATIGLLRLLMSDPCRALVEMHDTYGPVVEFGWGRFRYVYLFGPDANEYVLTRGAQDFTWREAFWPLHPVVGDTALVLSDGADHQRRRRVVQPAFHVRRIATYLDVMVAEADRVIGAWSPGQTVDAHAGFRDAIRRVVIRCLFGDRLAAREDELTPSLEEALAYVNRPPSQRRDLNLPGFAYRRALHARRRVDHIVFEEITRRQQAAPIGDAVKDGDDVLSWLVADHDDTPRLSDQEVRDQIVSLIAAGYDTTSSAMAWIVAELAQHPDVLDSINAEVHAVCGTGPLTIDALNELTVTQATVNEALRLHPPAIWSGRRATRAFDLHGHTIPAGSMILFSPYVTQRDPTNFARADQFLPGRWIDGHPDHAEQAPYTFVPFGGGGRRCLGFAFATQELVAMTATLARRVTFEPAWNTPPQPAGTMTMAPADGLPIRITSPVRRGL